MTGRHAAGRRCPDEPHELHSVTPIVADSPSSLLPGEEPDRVWEFLKAATRASINYFKDAPAERLPLIGGGLVYGAGMLLHHYGVPWWTIALPTVAGGIVAYAAGTNRLSMPSTIGVTLASLTCGAWLATAAEVGVGRLVNWVYLGGFALGYGIYRWALRRATKRKGGDAAPEVTASDSPRIEWERYFSRWDLVGAEVITAEPTRLGERALLNTKSTGRRASTYVGRALEELIAEDFNVATVRVSVTTAGLPAGQLLISVQLTDPWATAIPHPTLDPNSEIKLPEVADVREPLVIGMDPETGDPLTVTIWAEDGAKHTYVLAITGGGKSVTINDILERLTAAFNCVVWGINLSKAQEMRRWRPALDLAACGPEDRKKARLMLKMARKLVVYRGAQPRDTANVIPSARRKLLVVAIDEIDEFTKNPDGSIDLGVVEDLGKVGSKGRSEAVALIIAGQRNTQSHGGSTDVVTQMTNYVVLKGVSTNDLMRIGLAFPDMGEYGGGNPGVLGTMTKSEAVPQLGRSFSLAAGNSEETGLGQIDRIVANRPPNSLEGDEIAHLGDMYLKLKAGQMPSIEREPGQVDAEQDARPVDPTPEVTSSEERSHAIEEIRERHLFLVPTLTLEGQERLRQMRMAQRDQAVQEEQAAASALPADVRAKLVAMLDRDGGVATRDVEVALGVSNATAWRYMNQLRGEGAVESRGSGPATRWVRRCDDIA